MKSLLLKIIMVALAAAAPTCAPAAANAQNDVAQRGYSTQLLRDPVFDWARVTVEAIAINNWLVSNYKTLSAKIGKAPGNVCTT